MKKLFSIFLALIASTSIADEYTDECGTWTYTLSGNNATITALATNDVTEIIVPSKIGTANVIKINGSCFKNFYSITKITFPDTITRLYSSVCQNCTALKSVILPAKLQVLEGYVFDGCTALETVEPFLPETITELHGAIFRNCSNLTGKLTLHSKARTYYDNTFYNTGITSIDLGNCKNGSYSSGTFANCKKLETVLLPTNVTFTLNGTVFQNCIRLHTVTPFLPEKINGFYGAVFGGCSNLIADCNMHQATFLAKDSMFVNCGITGIDMSRSNHSHLNGNMFKNCKNLKWVKFNETNSTFEIHGSTFQNCQALTTLEPFFPTNLTRIYNSAFYGCTNLSGTAEFSVTTTASSDGAFSNTKVSTADFSNSTATNLENLFKNCASLTKIVFPECLTSVGNYITQNAKALQEIYFRGDKPTGISTYSPFSYTNYQARIYVDMTKDGWAGAKDSDANWTEPVDATAMEKYTAFFGENAPEPVAVWSINNKPAFVMNWRNPFPKANGTCIIMR